LIPEAKMANFVARHNLTSAQYQQIFDQLVGQGFRPTVVSGYDGGGQPLFAAIFEQVGGPAFEARHNLTSDQYQQTFDQLVGQGFRPTVVSGYDGGVAEGFHPILVNGYPIGGQPLFAAIFEQ
jgi:hypothetical protein